MRDDLLDQPRGGSDVIDFIQLGRFAVAHAPMTTVSVKALESADSFEVPCLVDVAHIPCSAADLSPVLTSALLSAFIPRAFELYGIDVTTQCVSCLKLFVLTLFFFFFCSSFPLSLIVGFVE
jgi:hypothetical protein